MEHRKHFYITLFSNAVQDLYPENKLNKYTIQLAQRIDLGSTDNWEVGLCEFSCPPKQTGTVRSIEVIGDTNALVYCDLIAPQFVGNRYVRCLRTFITPSTHCDHSFQNVYYVPVERRSFQDISILVLDLMGKPIPFKTGTVPTKAVLHFRRV